MKQNKHYGTCFGFAGEKMSLYIALKRVALSIAAWSALLQLQARYGRLTKAPSWPPWELRCSCPGFALELLEESATITLVKL
ncbi:hypothetical protein ES707_09783 [subsurface metagenome]